MVVRGLGGRKPKGEKGKEKKRKEKKKKMEDRKKKEGAMGDGEKMKEKMSTVMKMMLYSTLRV